MRTCAQGAIRHMLKQPRKVQSLSSLYTLSQDATTEAVHLICQMLVFDPVSRQPVIYDLPSPEYTPRVGYHAIT